MRILSGINKRYSHGLTLMVPFLLLTVNAWGQLPANVNLLVNGSAGAQFVGIAATPNLVVFTHPFCQEPLPAGGFSPREILQLNGDGSVTLFGTLPDIPFDGTTPTCYENYIAISPSGSNGWTSGDVFVATAHPGDFTSVDVYRFPSTGAAPHAGTLFGTYPGVLPQGGSPYFGGHSGLDFDTEGAWNYNLLLGGAVGVTVINSTGAVVTTIPNPTGDPNVVFESFSVAPPGFDGGLHAGWLFGQTDNIGGSTNYGVWAFGPPGCSGAGCTAYNAVTGAISSNGESIDFVPSNLCTFTVKGTAYPYFISVLDSESAFALGGDFSYTANIDGVPLAKFTVPAGHMLVQDEYDGAIDDFAASGSTYSTFVQFTTPPGVDQEGATIVSCPVQPFGGCTVTQGGWGSKPHGQNPGAFLAANFATAFPSGVTIGGSPYSLHFTSALAIQNFLPQGGPPGALNASATNPTARTSAGVFAGQVLALELNVTLYHMGSLTLSGTGTSLDGDTVATILALANQALAGGALPSGFSYSSLNDLVDNLNQAFDNCVADGYAGTHLH